jgi:(2Fe-2S) ferredoxin
LFIAGIGNKEAAMVTAKYHIVLCIGSKLTGNTIGTCGTRGAAKLMSALNMALDDWDLASDAIVSGSTCFSVCEKGPVMVVHESGQEPVWYGGIDATAIDEIVERHLSGGEPVAEYRI